ncbi:hypothetical protein Fsol_00197 [Candidatus Fokinia solitaria]|uniref:Uncharacterized protein n=1 Tax=Candidatus Fokinia solitaria TaxID=1802984 RepID=A0A2U8BRN4_9RICK|nr:hypothetical protein [Candidatus Fokinia solitaria]AWD33001.1 hypothetical protein Fsol_00197 [Candidatus Fokinia solitaria]
MFLSTTKTLSFTLHHDSKHSPCKASIFETPSPYLRNINEKLSSIYCDSLSYRDSSINVKQLQHLLSKHYNELNDFSDGTIFSRIVSNVYQSQYYAHLRGTFDFAIFEAKNFEFTQSGALSKITTFVQDLYKESLSKELNVAGNMLDALGDSYGLSAFKNPKSTAQKVRDSVSVCDAQEKSTLCNALSDGMKSLSKLLDNAATTGKSLYGKNDPIHKVIIGNTVNMIENLHFLREEVVNAIEEEAPVMPEFLYITETEI